MSQCIGIFGRLFGHKFIKGVGDYVYERDYCWRCGYKRGQGDSNA